MLILIKKLKNLRLRIVTLLSGGISACLIKLADISRVFLPPQISLHGHCVTNILKKASALFIQNFDTPNCFRVIFGQNIYKITSVQIIENVLRTSETVSVFLEDRKT